MGRAARALKALSFKSHSADFFCLFSFYFFIQTITTEKDGDLMIMMMNIILFCSFLYLSVLFFLLRLQLRVTLTNNKSGFRDSPEIILKWFYPFSDGMMITLTSIDILELFYFYLLALSSFLLLVHSFIFYIRVHISLFLFW